MFRYEYPVFEHKNLLKKSMLDELRDYPLSLSRMYFDGCGDGILTGCSVSWEKEVLSLQPGLILYGGDIYRMEEAYPLACAATGKRTYLKVRFAAMDYERSRRGGLGEILLDDNPAENGEMELGRFQLQEGARLRTTYENFEDYQTEYDTLNRIHVPYVQTGGAGLWPQLLKEYAKELLESGTGDACDISFAMTLLGADGHVSPACVQWYVQREEERRTEKISNEDCYKVLLHILRNRKSGSGGWRETESGRRQMILM